MKCPHCHAELSEVRKFCPKCGGALSEEVLEKETEQASQEALQQEERPQQEERFQQEDQFSSDMNEFYNQIYRQMKEYYVVEYQADGIQSVTADKEISVYVQNQDKGGESLTVANPGQELFDSLLGSYLRSYIVDMNNHSYSQLAPYVDDTVAADDQWSIQWQMKKQVTGGFSNVTEETLMDYSISEIQVEDENTIRLKSVENYDVIYDEVYGELKTSDRSTAKDAIQFIERQMALL